MIFKGLYLLLELVDGDLFILHSAHHLKLGNTIADGNLLAGAPNKAIHLNALHLLKHLIQGSLIIPRLHVEENRGLGNHLGFLGFLLVISLKTLFGDPLLFLVVFFVIRAEQINIIVVILSGSSSWSCTSNIALGGLGKLLHSSSEGLDVVVPPEGVGEL